jgi:DNA polymerase-3 subunit epsilon
MAATEIHGLTDADVADAPKFRDIAGDLVAAISDCFVAAYNVYFDARFLAYELGQVGVGHEPPNFCLMYMRPMLGLGPRCRLDEACRQHNLEYAPTHIAADDAQAASRLWDLYLKVIEERAITTFSELATLRSYKFFKSFANSPLPAPAALNLTKSGRFRSRLPASPSAAEPQRSGLGAYWDALRTSLADLEISDEEVERLAAERAQFQLPDEQVKMLHARAFASVISQFVGDQWLDDREVRKLQRLYACLNRLGWAPGQ